MAHLTSVFLMTATLTKSSWKTAVAKLFAAGRTCLNKKMSNGVNLRKALMSSQTLRIGLKSLLAASTLADLEMRSMNNFVCLSLPSNALKQPKLKPSTVSLEKAFHADTQALRGQTLNDKSGSCKCFAELCDTDSHRSRHCKLLHQLPCRGLGTGGSLNARHYASRVSEPSKTRPSLEMLILSPVNAVSKPFCKFHDMSHTSNQQNVWIAKVRDILV